MQKVIGLSGHIDHGKTTLVKALTGENTDRLVEEQKRGMTIDIGFAFLNDSITLIDVPGHEKFVKNMMAGVSGIDIAMLVVAADDGVMPQTREHFEILNLLDIPKGIIVINKIDLADDDLLDLVELDISELVEGTFMEKSSIIRVSATTMQGISELNSTLLNICKDVSAKDDRGIFRMHVDRAFSMKGYGTVVTGTVNSGSAKVGDTLELLPDGKNTRVRSLQSHGKDVQSVKLGDRAAINLQGINKMIISRGSQISEPNYLKSIKQMGVSLHHLSSSKKPIVQNQRVRVHLGTQEVMARIALTSTNALVPGSDAAALLRLEKPLVASRNDKFIIRSYSPILTIGGGEVLDVHVESKWQDIKIKIQELFDNPKSSQICKLVEQEGVNPLTLDSLKFRLGLSDQIISNIVYSNKDLIWKKHKQNKWLVTIKQWKDLKIKIKAFIKDFHKNNPMRNGIQKEEIRQYLCTSEYVVEALLQEMQFENIIIQKEKNWSSIDFKINLTSKDGFIQEEIINIIDKEGFTSSSLVDLSFKLGESKDKVMQIIKVAETQGKLIRIEGNLMFSTINFIKLKEKVILHFNKNTYMSVPEFKEIANTSRKYAVPLLEYFDKLKITYRDGHNRKLVR